MPAPRRVPLHVVVSCEHARCDVPPGLHRLGLPAALLRRHVSWDPGALPVARALARALRAPLHLGRWSRLVADLNRSEGHPRVVPRTVAGRPIPGNAHLDARGRGERLRRWWAPYRTAVAHDVAAAAAYSACLHLSVHSFVERLGGIERKNDVGLLFDPWRPREREFVAALQRELGDLGLRVRKNFPYFGFTDGITSHLRTVHTGERYLGVEIELNQRLARSAKGQRRLARALSVALRAVLGTPLRPRRPRP